MDGLNLLTQRRDLLAPLGIRYVIVPRVDGVLSTDEAPLPLPTGLVASLQNQLDFGAVYGSPTLEIFLNQSWLPVGAILTGPTAVASTLGSADALVRADLSAATPVLAGVDQGEPRGTVDVPAGVLHLAIPFDERIELEVGGRVVAPRPGFGVSTARK